MTEEQKSRFCDEYCKYLDEANKYTKAAIEHTSDGEARQALIYHADNRLRKHCEACIMNEV